MAQTTQQSPTPREDRQEPRPIPPDRLSTLADGVFAIAMTLLVLELGVPAVSAGELADALAEMWPEFLIYGLSFFVASFFSPL